MPSNRLLSALTFVVTLGAIALVAHPTAHTASATPAQPLQTTLTGLCYHTDLSEYHCPDSTMSRLLIDANSIQRVSITVIDKAGNSYTNDLPATTDAVFLSVKSVRSFLLLHYQATNAAKAKALSTYLGKPAAEKAAAKKPVSKPPE